MILYWLFTVPGDKWQNRGVISMFFICQRNAESMTKQFHTLYGFAVHPEKVSWTTVPRLVIFLFNSLSTLVAHWGINWSLRCLSLRRSSPLFSVPTTTLGDLRWRLGRNAMVMCFTSESFILFLPSSCVPSLMSSFTLVEMKTNSNSLLLSQVSCKRRPGVQPNCKWTLRQR